MFHLKAYKCGTLKQKIYKGSLIYYNISQEDYTKINNEIDQEKLTGNTEHKKNHKSNQEQRHACNTCKICKHKKGRDVNVETILIR